MSDKDVRLTVLARPHLLRVARTGRPGIGRRAFRPTTA
jgi:hypothetical protein